MQIYLTTISSSVSIEDLGAVTFIHPTIDAPLIQPEGQFTSDEILNSYSLQELLDAGLITLHDGTNHPIEDVTVNNSIQWPSLQPGYSVCGFSLNESTNEITHKMMVPMECYAETNNSSDNGENYNNSSAKVVKFRGENFSNSPYFTWDSTNYRWVVAKGADSGRLAASSIINLYTWGIRVHVTARVVRIRGNTYTYKRLGSTYMRNGNWHDRDTISGTQYFDYQAGDEFYVDIFRDGSTTTTTYINDYSNFSLRRVG